MTTNVSEFTQEQTALIEYIKGRIGINFNEGQTKLLYPTSKPMLAFAVPGSGKTNTLTLRVWNLELVLGIPAEYIWVVTFTKKAAREFQKRHKKFGALIDPSLQSRVKVKTIHAMCYQYVDTFQKECGLGGFNLMMDGDSESLLKEVMTPLKKKGSPPISTSEVKSVLSAINWFDNRLLFTREEITHKMEFKDLKMSWEHYKKIYDNFKYIMKSTGSLTQDETMMHYLNLLRTNKNVREVVQKGIQYICVDEFQDTTPLQYEIIKMMKAPDTGITVVGDSDQSIYRWRGATNIVFNFMNDFQDHVKAEIGINYRCPDNVINAANNLIKNNNLRLPISATGTGKKGKITILPCTSNKQASMEIGNRIITEYMESGRDNHTLIDKLILYRNHSQAMFLLYMLATNEVPVNTSGATLPHKDKIVKDIHDIIMLLKNPRDSQMAHKCMRFISSQIRNTPKDKCPFYNSGNTEHFAKVPVSVRDMSLYQNELVELINISKMIADDLPAVQIFQRIVPMYMNNYYMKNNVYDFIGKTQEDAEAVVSFLYTAVPEDYTYSQFLFMMNQAEQFLNSQKSTFVGLDIYSMHGAKGLEADKVYILDSNGKTNPSQTKIDALLQNSNYPELEDYISEERSLFFVAATRAGVELIMTYNVNNPSPFNLESGLHKDLTPMPERLSLRTLGVSEMDIKRAHNTLLGKPTEPVQQELSFPTGLNTSLPEDNLASRKGGLFTQPQPDPNNGTSNQQSNNQQHNNIPAPPTSLFGGSPTQNNQQGIDATKGAPPSSFFQGAMSDSKKRMDAKAAKQQEVKSEVLQSINEMKNVVNSTEERPEGRTNNLFGR